MGNHTKIISIVNQQNGSDKYQELGSDIQYRDWGIFSEIWLTDCKLAKP